MLHSSSGSGLIALHQWRVVFVEFCGGSGRGIDGEREGGREGEREKGWRENVS